ncbi:unnamed protein product [Mycena citricolor]|uniref:Uncharacterized protein n=1 Tax=Mycena citricolor TaxID=2018698 RepID=A0AAD2HL42_9AGAR|nr:unnamed protein product [Mycena citricolor]
MGNGAFTLPKAAWQLLFDAEESGSAGPWLSASDDHIAVTGCSDPRSKRQQPTIFAGSQLVKRAVPIQSIDEPDPVSPSAQDLFSRSLRCQQPYSLA